jgi:hypothetical protein
MLNLFPIFGTPNDSISSEEFMGWKATQTPSYIQAQDEMIGDLFKKNYELKKENEKLKKENVELIERVNEIDNDVIRDLQDEILVCKNDYAVLKEENEKLKKDIVDFVFEKDDEIEKIKAQKHPMYPLHWGGVSNLFQKAKDLTEGVEVDLDKSLDEQPKSTRGKIHNMYFSNEVPHEWEAKPETSPNEFQEFEECKITGYKIPKEKSWEEAAGDLALRVAKLEEHIKYMPKVSFTE